MNPPTLILEIEMRGASIRCAGDRLKVTNDQALTPSLRAKIRENKPAIISILAHGDSFADAAQPRRVNEFVWAPVNPKPASPGAVKIAATMQGFERTHAAALRGKLPRQPLDALINGELFTVENVAAACIEIERAWTNTAQWCQHERRELSAPEVAALDAAAQFLETVTACYNGNRAAWLDLGALNSQLDADFRAMQRKQRKRGASQSEAPR